MKCRLTAAAMAFALAGFGTAGANAAGPAAAATAAASPDFHGIGPLRFGMSEAQMRQAWGRPLHGGALPGDPNGNACYYLFPHKDGRGLMFMVAEGHFARTDVADPTLVAPGGGRIGMPVSALRKLYAGRISTTPNKYDAAASEWRVAPPAGASGLLLFEVGKAGTVTDWRIGNAEQVNYVEGCG